MSMQKDRLSALIKFTQQTLLMGKNPVTNISQHTYFTKLEEQVQGLPGVRFNQDVETDDETWLYIERLHERSAPLPDNKVLQLWLAFSHKFNQAPTLKERVLKSSLLDLGVVFPHENPNLLTIRTNDDSSSQNDEMLEAEEALEYVELIEFFDKKSIEEALTSYVKTKWEPWLEQEKQRRKTIKLYSDLFMLSKELQGNLADAKLELVWGVGMSLWKKSETDIIQYPLLTQAVEIFLDKDTMALSVKPSLSPVKLETEPFSDMDLPNLVDVVETSKLFFKSEESSFSPFKVSTYAPILNSAASLIDPSGMYWPNQPDYATTEDRKLPKVTDNLIVTDTWVLMARPRSDGFLLQDLEKFIDKLQDMSSENISGVLAAILTEPDTFNKEVVLPAYRGISAVTGSDNSHSRTNDLYFPKPYNDEQVRIIQMLQAYDGVVVQGPPGTGKTHTIANVICHYLALGKRVLVTSIKDPALSVLQEKLPEKIQPLAVSLLSSETDSIKQFESSIRKISSEVSSIDRKKYQTIINQLEEEIDKTHANLAVTDTAIKQWGRLNLEDVIIDNEHLTPLEAAKEVASEQVDISWFPDSLGIDDKFKPQFANADIVSLQKARGSIKDKLNYLNQPIPYLDDFPVVTQIMELHANLMQLADLQQAESEGVLPPLANNDITTIQSIENTLPDIHQIDSLLNKINIAEKPWLQSLKQCFYDKNKTEVIQYFFGLKAEIDELLAKRTSFITKPVSMPQDFDNDAELVQAVKDLSEDKKPFGLAGWFGKKAEKQLLDKIEVLGAKAVTIEDWQHVYAFIEFRLSAKVLITRWNALTDEISLPVFDPKAESLPALKSSIELIEALYTSYQLEQKIQAVLQSILPSWSLSKEDNYSLQAIGTIDKTLQQHLTKHSLSKIQLLQENLSNVLLGKTGAITSKFDAFINYEIGNDKVSEESIKKEWLGLIGELQHIHDLADDFQVINEVTKAIENSGAIKWADKLRNEPVLAAEDKLLPDNWGQVWRLNRLVSFVNHIDARHELVELASKRKELESTLARLYQEVITKRTWLHLAENATPDVRAALEKYRAAIVRIGKGTGKRAPRYRREAQEASERASAAIPCWIMPHYRISESLPAEFGSFDLVIIDEASQSDLTALPALMRAKKVLVVGDDKQVSPDAVGLKEEKIQDLMNQFLTGQVDLYRSQMTPERSIYDLFKVVFAGSAVMLKEHFRCAPPIIEFSKREFYDHELKPLRKPKVSERLDPPLIDVHVTDGYRNNRKINPPEARFIVDEIRTIVEDPIYKGRTIGVVSLLGNEQAREIMEMLSRELGEKTITEFDIACGDARTFQGKERDIMFLSLIVSPGDAFAQTKESFAQRINVAASRARDRMYLVRSIELDELSSADVYRAKLIRHFQQPYLHDKEQVESLRSKCESPFEEEVFDILTEHGYRVIPQVEVGQYRIDMVVEGEDDNSLAIECDGDRYHGPDKWESDINRQRILERAGWRFWRCFASTFVMHKEAIIEELVGELTKLNIHPISSAEPVSNLYTMTRTVTAIADEIDSVADSRNEVMPML